MGADPKLVQIARTAEGDATLPQLRLATAAQLVIGTPGPSSRFNEATWKPIVDEVWKRIASEEGTGKAWTMKGAAKRVDAAEGRWELTEAELRKSWGPGVNAPEPDPPENLTLYDAIVWGWGESAGLRVPAVRVALGSISSWWVGNAEVIRSSGGTGWFGLVSLPINLGN